VIFVVILMVLDELTKHVIVGGGLAFALEPVFEDMVKRSSLSDPEKRKVIASLICSLAGGLAGYFAGERVLCGPRGPNGYCLKEKLISGGVGAFCGGLSGYLSASYLLKSRESDLKKRMEG
jgi:hypothetical protein